MFLLVICRDMGMALGMLCPGIEKFLVVLTGIYNLSALLGPHCASLLALRKT